MAIDKTNEPKVFTDDRTKKKIDKHLSDINDKISDQDIANVKTDVTPTTPDTDTEAEIEVSEIVEQIKKDKGDKETGSNSNNIQTPWNIMDNR
jgi:hypothetical protein